MEVIVYSPITHRVFDGLLHNKKFCCFLTRFSLGDAVIVNNLSRFVTRSPGQKGTVNTKLEITPFPLVLGLVLARPNIT